MRIMRAVVVGILSLAVSATSISIAQEPKSTSDDALDSLIEKLGDANKDKSDGLTSSSDKKDTTSPKEKSDSKSDVTSGESKAASGESGVSSKDQELDSLLEKLGETKDEPKAEDSKKPMPGSGGSDKPDLQAKKNSAPDPLGKKDQELDERLEELTGRKKKKKQSDSDDGQGSGPVSEIVKRMREIEQRLGKPDTGEETQKKQKEIVKNLETLIEQARQSGSSSSQRMKMKQAQQKGQNQKGQQQQGQEEGAMAGGAPNTKPSRPTTQKSLAGGKGVWGHLPPELRQEMENIYKEEALPDKIELIKRYYLSVSKNKPHREN